MNRSHGLLLALVLVPVAGVAWGKQPTHRLPDIERGRQLYERHCVQCHGDAAAGNGPATAALVAKVPDLSGKLTPDRLDADVREVLDGKGAMPSFVQSFDKYDARRTLRYMAKVGSPPKAPPPAEPEPASDDDSPGDDAGN